MKLAKTLAIATTLLAVFGIGHVRALVTHGRFGCAAAAAQQGWNAGGGGSEADDDASTEPEKKTKTPPPDVAGHYEGELMDSLHGDSAIEMTINQNGKRLSGTWNTDFGGTTFKGSINSAGTLKLDMKAPPGSCHLSAVGMLVAAGEITATYKVESCGNKDKGDHGTFDIFLL